MIVKPEILNCYVHGALELKTEEDGYFRFLRFTKEQIDFFSYEKVFWERCYSSSGIYLEFDTNTTKLAFSYKIDKICSFDTIDLWVNGILVKSQSYSFENCAGEFVQEFPAGGKRVRIVLPLYASCALKDFTVDDGCNLVPVKNRGKRVLVLGDSISQGNGAQTSSCSYVWTLSRTLGWNVLNQGIGGYVHHAEGLMPIDFKPEAILVAFGANDFRSSRFAEKAEAFYERLSQMYPEVPVYAVSPIWMDREDNAELWTAKETLEKVVSRYPNVRFFNGLSMVPHMKEFYMDGVHPARHGHLHYGASLATAILQEA